MQLRPLGNYGQYFCMQWVNCQQKCRGLLAFCTVLCHQLLQHLSQMSKIMPIHPIHRRGSPIHSVEFLGLLLFLVYVLHKDIQDEAKVNKMA